MNSLEINVISEAIRLLRTTVEEYIQEFGGKAAYEDERTYSEWRGELQSAFAPYMNAVKQLNQQIEQFNDVEANAAAFRIMQSLSSVDSQLLYASAIIQMKSDPIGRIKSAVKNAARAAGGALGTLLSRVGAILKGLAGQIWQILANLINIKEWSVKGAVSTPALSGFFGITGALELSVTFQP